MKQAKLIFSFLIVANSFFSFEKMNCMQRKQFFVVIGLVGFSYLAYKVISNHFFKDLRNLRSNAFSGSGEQEQKNFHEVYTVANQMDSEVKVDQEVFLERTPTLFDIKKHNSKLIQVIKANDYEAVKSLVSKGSEITIEAFIEALKNNIKIFKLLIEKGGRGLPQELKNMYLQYAVQIEKNVDLTISVINTNADINMVDCRGRTLLHLAILENNSEIVDVLIKKGINLSKEYKKKFFFKKNETLSLFDYLTYNLDNKNKSKRLFAQKCLNCINEALGICSICLEKNMINLGIFMLTCGHIFHDDCINTLLESSFTCPICRCPLDPLLI